jgi:hypothetical protein
MVEKIVIEEKFALVNKNSGLKWSCLKAQMTLCSKSDINMYGEYITCVGDLYIFPLK